LAGYFKTSILIYDSVGNSNWTQQSGIINVSFHVDLNPPYFTDGTPYNMEVEAGVQVKQQINATDDVIGIGGWNVNDTNFAINSSGWFTNDTFLTPNIYWVNITVWDSVFAHENSSVIYVNVTDTISPTCKLISVIPSDIESNSTGTFEAIINCTDISGINISRYLIIRTIEGFLHAGLPNLWSVRFPENDKAEEHIDPPHSVP